MQKPLVIRPQWRAMMPLSIILLSLSVGVLIVNLFVENPASFRAIAGVCGIFLGILAFLLLLVLTMEVRFEAGGLHVRKNFLRKKIPYSAITRVNHRVVHAARGAGGAPVLDFSIQKHPRAITLPVAPFSLASRRLLIAQLQKHCPHIRLDERVTNIAKDYRKAVDV